MIGNTYIFKVKGKNASALFKYTLNGNLMEFKADGNWTAKEYDYLLGTLPKKETEVPGLKKVGKDFYDIETIPTDLSFDRFWSDYSKHGTKSVASAKYKKLKETEQILAIQYIEVLKKIKQKEGTQMPYAETYLNQKRWEV